MPVLLSQARTETFVATLAHELRQPLATLLAAVEVVRLGAGGAPTTRITDSMRRQIRQMNRVVEDLLDATRWARGKVTLRIEHLDMREVMSEAALDVAAAVAGRGQQLVVDTATDALWMDADPQRLHQVLSNLLRNAVKYTDPGGRIRLTATRDAHSIIVRVSDTGRGIAPEALTQIFDLFAQVAPSESAGQGLGLSVVREIVQLHGGAVEARSAGPGRGSEFVVTLPLARR